MTECELACDDDFSNRAASSAKLVSSPAFVAGCVSGNRGVNHESTLHHGRHGNGGVGDSEAPSIHISAALRELCLRAIAVGPDPAYGRHRGAIGSAGQGEWTGGEKLYASYRYSND